MIHFAALILTSPLMLWGMAAVALPVIAHLLNRPVRRRVVFPTVRLLREAAASRSHLFRLRHSVLLTLRCAAVALLAWAFARPVWTEAHTTAGGSRSGAAVVLILDISASSGQRSDGVAVVDRMIGAAERALDALEPGSDVANLIYAGVRPRAAYPQPVANLDALRQELRELRPTHERADLAAAVALAASMLAEHTGPRRIILFSDMQRTNWDELMRSPLRVESIDLRIVPIGSPGAANTGIVRASAIPARPVVGQPARVTASLVNFADRQRDVTLTAMFHGRPLGARSFSIAPRRQQDVSFDLAFDEPGPHRLVLSTRGDDLALDDRAYVVVEAVERIPLLLITDEDPAQPTSSAYYITRALAPAGNESDTYEVKVLRSIDVNDAALTGSAAVIIGEVRPLGATAAESLVEYIAEGGGVLMFLGGGPARANAAALAHQARGEPLLPFQPLQRLDRETRFIGEGAWTSAALRSFDEITRLALREIAFHRTHATGELHGSARALLRFADSTPALAVSPYRSGYLMLANFSPAPSHSDVAKHGAFVALLHGMVDQLRADNNRADPLTVGDSLAAAEDDTGDIRIIGPDDQPIAVTKPTDQPGFYTIIRNGEPVAVHAVNIDEREADLRRIDATELNIDGFITARQRSALGEAPHRGEPIWWWFVLAASGAAGLEMLLLSLWKR